MVGRCVRAADILEENGISARVLEIHTLKPIDVDAICEAAELTRAVVTAEEHSIIGDLGGAVAEVLIENCPVPMKRVGVKDRFPVTAKDADLLMDYMGLRVEDVVESAIEVIKRKQS
jgi:transketolase